MLLTSSYAEQLTPPVFTTVASAVKNKKTTMKNRCRSGKRDSKEQRSSRILPAASAGREKGLSPYWNDYIAEKSSVLWLPTKIVLHDLVSSLSNSWQSKTGTRSWFSMTQVRVQKNSHRIFCPSSTGSLVACTDYDGIDRRAKKIRVYPSSDQRQKIRVWMDAARWFYNQTVEVLTSEDAPYPNYIKVWHIIKACDIPERFSIVPYQIKRNAVKEACASLLTIMGFVA